jgi:hypothetical protein
MTGFGSSPWWEPVDDFAFPFNYVYAPDGLVFYFGCKHCRAEGRDLYRCRVEARGEGGLSMLQAFQCENCRRWLTIRSRNPEPVREPTFADKIRIAREARRAGQQMRGLV